jgi:hypothetical protein
VVGLAYRGLHSHGVCDGRHRRNADDSCDDQRDTRRRVKVFRDLRWLGLLLALATVVTLLCFGIALGESYVYSIM